MQKSISYNSEVAVEKKTQWYQHLYSWRSKQRWLGSAIENVKLQGVGANGEMSQNDWLDSTGTKMYGYFDIKKLGLNSMKQ